MKEERAVAFTGPRNLPGLFAPLVFQVVDQVAKAKRNILVGCAAGLDYWVRRRCEEKSYPYEELNVKDKCDICHGSPVMSGDDPFGVPAGTCQACDGTGCKYGKPFSKAAFVKRSVDMINRLEVQQIFSGEPSTLIGFPDRACPRNILPGPQWTSGEVASGTWSTIALAIGSNIHTILFPCTDDRRHTSAILVNDWPYAWKKTSDKSPWNMSYECRPGQEKHGQRLAEIIEKEEKHA